MSKETYQYINSILDSLENLLSNVSAEEIEFLGRSISEADRIFLAGAGRSGLIIETFAMRLVHLGFDAEVVGYPVTPAARREDLVLIASGSGETSTIRAIARQAKKKDVKTCLITAVADSTIAGVADEVVCIKKASREPANERRQKFNQPLGSPFEQSLFIVLESLVSHLMEKRGINEGEMARRHANLE